MCWKCSVLLEDKQIAKFGGDLGVVSPKASFVLIYQKFFKILFKISPKFFKNFQNSFSNFVLLFKSLFVATFARGRAKW